jgi:hypothetical protein
MNGLSRDAVKVACPDKTHDLKTLLDFCKGETLDTSSFIYSNFLDVIVQRFNPFNEIARYPVQRMKTSVEYKDGRQARFDLMCRGDLKALFLFKTIPPIRAADIVHGGIKNNRIGR